MLTSVEVRLPRGARVVVVDRLDLGVEVDGGLALLARSDAGVLDSAERQLGLAADRGRVHVDDPAFDLLDEAEDRRGVARVDARREPVLDARGDLERLLEPVDAG